MLANFKTAHAKSKILDMGSDPHIEKPIRSLEDTFLSGFKAIYGKEGFGKNHI